MQKDEMCGSTRNNTEIDHYLWSPRSPLWNHSVGANLCLHVTDIFHTLPFNSIASLSGYMNDPMWQTLTVIDWYGLKGKINRT
jgi:hypothetical protein